MKVESILKVLSYAIAFVSFVSVARSVSAPSMLVFIGLGLFALASDFIRKMALPRWSLNLLALLALGAGFARMDAGNVVIPAIEVLLILLVLKFAEIKQARDYMQIYALSVFVLSASSLLSLDMIFLVYLIVFLFLLSAAILILSFFSEDPDILIVPATARKMAVTFILIPTLVLPTTALLFLILPRTSYPLFNFLNRSTVGTSGFTDNVELGTVSQIQEDETIVFRAQMERIPYQELYWRGLVFDHFDGRSWKRSENAQSGTAQRRRWERPIRYTVYLEPFDNNTLFTLDRPLYVGFRDIVMTEDLTCSLGQSATKRIKYLAFSSVAGVLPGPEPDSETYLQLPHGLDPIKNLADRITQGKSGIASLRAIHAYLRKGMFTYSLTNLPLSRTPIEDFLFRYHYGNCEYFASAMAVMLRMSGIPARLVGGYLGGYYSNVGRYYAVPQRNAHVWVEAYIKDVGWIRIDPTPAVTAAFNSPAERGLLFAVRIALDSIQYYWNIFVINYDLQTQFFLVTKLQSAVEVTPAWFRASRKSLIISAVSLVSMAAIFLLSSLLIRYWRRPRGERTLRAFLRKMETYGYVKHEWEGLEEFVSSVQEETIRTKAQRFVESFQKLYYRDVPITSQDVRSLRRLIDDILSSP